VASVLHESKVTRLKTAAEVFLSPFDYPGLRQWTAAVAQVIEGLFHAEWSLSVVPAEERRVLCTGSVPGEDAAVVHAVVSYGESPLPQRTGRPPARQAWQRAAAGMNVQADEALDELAGEALCHCAHEGETRVPDGLGRFVRLRASSATAPAELVWGHSDSQECLFDVEEELEAAAMLLPAYRAGILD